MKILFFGDSVTDAKRNQLGEYVDSYGAGYVFYAIGDLLREDPAIIPYNRGISGNRIVDLYARIKADCWNLTPDLISILIGVNEVLHEEAYQNGTELPRFIRMYETIIEETKERLPGVRLMLCEPFSLIMNEEAGQSERYEAVRAYAEAVGSLAEKYQLPFVALQEVLDAAAKAHGPAAVLRDGVHPTSYGARLIADEWMKVYKTI